MSCNFSAYGLKTPFLTNDERNALPFSLIRVIQPKLFFHFVTNTETLENMLRSYKHIAHILNKGIHKILGSKSISRLSFEK